MIKTVYILDLPMSETWDSHEIARLTNEYGVEIETTPKIPYRAVALNHPINGKPIYLTWRAECMLQEAEYKDRWASDESFGEPSRRFDGMPGCMIPDLIKRMIALMVNRLGTVTANLNGVDVVVKDGDSVEERWAWMQNEQDRKHQAYILSSEYKEKCRLADEKVRKSAADLAALLVTAPEHMALKDEAGWKKIIEVNADNEYGAAVTVYAELWARLMEANMAKGSTIEDCADECSYLANTDRITGFMYDCAVSILSQVWTHGETLRLWHNKSTQIGTEGDNANKTGGVLNPALLGLP